MIDIHAHVLPRVDDGARSEADAIAMLEEAKAAGVTTIVATPHVNLRGYDRERHLAAYKALKPEAASRGIRLVLGCELNIAVARTQTQFDSFCFAMERQGERFLLLEFDLDTKKAEASFMISDVLQQGIIPIIAHPERYSFVQRDPHALSELRSYGALIQVDAQAFLESFWHPERRAVKKMLREGLIDCVASDAHRPGDYASLVKAGKAAGGVLSKQSDFFA